MGSPVYVTLVIEGTRLRAAGEKQKQTKIQKRRKQNKSNQNPPKPRQTNSAHEEINLWIKVMCWQSSICWLLSDAAELVQWINDFFSILLHLFQPLPSFITTSLLCYSG